MSAISQERRKSMASITIGVFDPQSHDDDFFTAIEEEEVVQVMAEAYPDVIYFRVFKYDIDFSDGTYYGPRD